MTEADYTNKTYAERVASGVEFLHISGPAEWWDRVDVENIDMTAGDSCILGQVFAPEAEVAGYYTGYDFIAENVSGTWEIENGFLALSSSGYNNLAKEWADAIVEIRAMVSA